MPRSATPTLLTLCAISFLAISAIAQGGKKNPPDAVKQADTAFHEGYAARQAGNLELARTKFAEVVHLEPKIAEGHEALGAVLVELGKPLEGAKEFEAAAKIKPSDDGIETNLALAYSQAAAKPGNERSIISSLAVREMRKYPGSSTQVPGRTRMSWVSSRSAKARSSAQGDFGRR